MFMAIVNGTAGNDFLVGTAEDDTIDGLDGDDSISGGDGFDTLHGQAGSDSLWSGQQGDADSGLEHDHLFGGDGNDTLSMGFGDDVDGGAGADSLQIYLEAATSGAILDTSDFASSTGATVGGGTIRNIESVSHIVGSTYADTITIGTQVGSVTVAAGQGDDTIIASASPVTADGGLGDDRFFSGSAADTFEGGSGFNWVDYSLSTNPIAIFFSPFFYQPTISSDGDRLSGVPNVVGTAFADKLVGATGGGNVFIGLAGNDVLDGGGGHDTLDGGDGDDTLLGGSLEDVLLGGDGRDTLTGGSEIDILTGGAGNDTFTDSRRDLSGDTITDFGVGDKIIITDATLETFSFSLSDSTLTYTGGTLTFSGGVNGTISASAVAGGGVQLMLAQTVQAGVDPAGDFNGDGKDDLIWRRGDGAFTEWLGQPNGGFASNDANAWTALPTSWRVVGSGDFNGDGRDDLIWRNDRGVFTSWLGHANGGFVSNDANAWRSDIPVTWQVAGTGDFNGDNRDDVLWRREDGAFTEWLGQANGGFTSNDANAWNSVPTNWHIVGIGDFNDDNRDDVIWRRDDGAFTNWLGQASGGFVSNDADAWRSDIPIDWQVAGTGDFNGDGRADILWRRDDGAFTDWLGQASGGFTSNDANAWTVLPTSWKIVATGDFNGDGRDDIAWRRDDGTLTDWLGQSNGGFASNDANAWRIDIPQSWQVQLGDQLI
jgi:Ca2+-binding RTX toxin-like protein